MKAYLLEKGHPQLSSKISMNLASSSRRVRPDTTGNTMRLEKDLRREPQDSSIPVPRFQRGAGVYDHTGGIYSHNGVVDSRT